MKLSTRFLGLGSAALLAACGAETGNGVATVVMKLTGENGGAFVTTDQQGTSFGIESARAHIRRIDFEAPGQQLCKDEDYADSGIVVHCDSAKIRIETPLVIDLMTGQTTPSLANVKIPAATYKRVDARFSPARVADGEVQSTDRLAEHSIDISGAFQHMNMETDFKMRLAFEEDAIFSNSEGITVAEGGVEQVLLLLDVRQWFTQLPITACIDDGDLVVENGSLEIEDRGGARCNMLEKSLKDAIKASSQLSK